MNRWVSLHWQKSELESDSPSSMAKRQVQSGTEPGREGSLRQCLKKLFQLQMWTVHMDLKVVSCVRKWPREVVFF